MCQLASYAQSDTLMNGVRTLSYALLAVSILWLAAYRGDWYALHIFKPKDDTLAFTAFGVFIKDKYNKIAIFTAVPVILTAALGGVYKVLWMRRERKSAASDNDYVFSTKKGSWMRAWSDIVHFQLQPIRGFSAWFSIGEVIIFLLWVGAMAGQWYQNVESHTNRYLSRVEPCTLDPSSYCWRDGASARSPAQYRLREAAIAFGFLAAIHFGASIIPISRDSIFLSAIGVPFERALLYHIVLGKLAFLSMLLHAALFVVYWVREGGWSHVLRESMSGGTGVNITAGWLAFMCAVPMLITAFDDIRRRSYALFRLLHWLFIGIFIFSSMHSAHLVLYYMGGLTLYTIHASSRSDWLKSWKISMMWWKRGEVEISPTVVDILSTAKYTRLVLRNPRDYPPRGGSFVYIRAPCAVGEGEKHPFTVALRGPPPAFSAAEQPPPDDTFTIYAKAVGRWTKSLRDRAECVQSSGATEPLALDVDGWYSRVDSLKWMSAQGVSRVVMIAGGSGLTAFLGLLQDWVVAAERGGKVPDVHLAWSCREMEEMKLVGESLPTVIASARRTAGESSFNMSLFCSNNDYPTETLAVTWPVQDAFGQARVTESSWIGIQESIRVLFAGGAAYAGWLTGTCIAKSQGLSHTVPRGLISLMLTVVAVMGVSPIYRTLHNVFKLGTRWSSWNVEREYELMPGSSNGSDGAYFPYTSTYPVVRGRVPIKTLLESEAAMAKANSESRVKVLVSGPKALVDSVMYQARAIDWRLFDTEQYSFEF